MSGRQLGVGWCDGISELTLRAARPFPWHHHSAVEIICSLKGAFAYDIRGRTGVTLPAGCCLVMPAGVEHRLTGGVDAPGRRFSVFLRLWPQTGVGAPFCTAAEYRDLLADVLRKRFRPRAFPPSVSAGLVRLADLTARRGALSRRERVEMRALLAAALVAFASAPAPALEKPQTRLMDEAVNWLKAHAGESVSMGQLVAYMGYGRSRFFELFKQHTGATPLEWLTRRRIDLAKRLLAGGGCSVAEVALRVGFADPSFFSRTFRRLTGMSPRAFAALNGGG